MTWIDRPLSPVELEQVFFGRFPLSTISYHTKTLARAGAIRKVGDRRVRGAYQSFYVLVDS